MINEILSKIKLGIIITGCMILEEGYALRASDIDVIMLMVMVILIGEVAQ